MKKILCTILCLTLVLTSTCFVFASDSETMYGTLDIERQIEAAKATEYAELHRQLEAQGALELMDMFVAELDKIIENEVLMTNGIDTSVYSTNDYRLNYPDGGLLGYENSIGGHVLSTYVLPEIGEQYIIPGETLTIAEIANLFLGTIPAWGQAFSMLFSLKIKALASQSTSIENADGYAQIMNVRDISGSENATYIRGWTTYPYINVTTAGLSNIHFTSY